MSLKSIVVLNNNEIIEFDSLYGVWCIYGECDSSFQNFQRNTKKT